MNKIKLELFDSQIVRLKMIKGFRYDDLDSLIDHIIDHTYETCQYDCDETEKSYNEFYEKLQLLKGICEKYDIDNSYLIEKFQNNLELDENDEELEKFSSKDRDIIIDLLVKFEDEF